MKTARRLLLALTLLIVEIPARAQTPCLYIAADSTASNGSLGDGSNRQWGRGAPLADYFDCSRINAENHAMSSTSSRTYRSLGLWAKQAAEEAGGRFIDLNERVASIFEGLGPDLLRSLYYASGDHSHTSAAGATFNARRVIEGIRDLKGSNLADYFRTADPQ